MEPISLIVGSALFVAGLVTGRVARRRGTPLGDPTAATCDGCAHSLTYHNTDGTCSQQIKRRHYNLNGDRSGHKWVQCGCRQYVGPIPAERMLASFPLPTSGDENGPPTTPRRHP